MRARFLMSARLAAAFTTCQIALGVMLSPQILSIRLTRRKIIPPLMQAAVVHSSTARFAHTGTGTVRMCFPLPTRSAIPQCSADLEIFCSETNQFGPSQAASNEQRQNRPITFAL
jgi:hypothetical protein